MKTSIATLFLTVIEIFRISKRQEQSVNKRFFLKNTCPRPEPDTSNSIYIGAGATGNPATLQIYIFLAQAEMAVHEF